MDIDNPSIESKFDEAIGLQVDVYCEYLIPKPNYMATTPPTTYKKRRHFKCLECDFSLARLSKHIHDDFKPFKCPECDFRALERGSLKRHLRRHDKNKIYNCKTCNYKTPLKSLLVKHIKSHSNEGPFHCNYCDFKSTHKSNIIRHIQIHLGNRPFKCPHCHYEAPIREALSRHLDTHAKRWLSKNEYVKKHILIQEKMYVESPKKCETFKCNYCDYSTQDKNRLTTHLYTHDGEKQYKCNHCEFTTLKMSNLTHHQYCHAADKHYKCLSCGYSSIDLSNVARHAKVHPTVKLHQCKQCDYKTSFQSCLHSHLQTHSLRNFYNQEANIQDKVSLGKTSVVSKALKAPVIIALKPSNNKQN